MQRYPTISIVTCLYNGNLSIWHKTLEGIKKQKYPKHLIEHIVMDGGSNNATIELAKSYGCIIHVRRDLLKKALVRMKIGIQKAKGEIILLLEPDNIILDKDWLRKMVRPFMDSNNIVGTFSMYNSYESDMPILTKYSALIGVNDPLVYYLGKSEKMPRFQSHYSLGQLVNENKNHYTVRFTKDNLPTLGDNGHMVRRKLILSEIKKMRQFYHTDAFYNLLKKGYDTYGVVKNDIIHYTGSDIIHFFKKRSLYKSQFYDNNAHNRTYFVFSAKSKKDVFNLIKFIIFSVTLIQPLFFSIRGFIKVRSIAWFLHPAACILTVFFYTKSELKRLL